MLAALLAAARPARARGARALATAAGPPAPPPAIKSMNMCAAINDALATVMETDPK